MLYKGLVIMHKECAARVTPVRGHSERKDGGLAELLGFFKVLVLCHLLVSSQLSSHPFSLKHQ